MRKALDVEVTQDDIDKGQHVLDYLCPVALAIKRKLPMARNVHVRYSQIRIDDGLYEVSETLFHWMRDWDAGAKVKPHTFRIKKQEQY